MATLVYIAVNVALYSDQSFKFNMSKLVYSLGLMEKHMNYWEPLMQTDWKILFIDKIDLSSLIYLVRDNNGNKHYLTIYFE